jgi:hypothetical protein
VLRGARIAVVLGAIGSTLALAQAAPAATLVGDYQLQGTRASSGPGPALADAGGTNSFQSDTVMGASRQVLAFPQGSGVEMSPAGLGAYSANSIVTTFRFDETFNYRRILDTSGGVDDHGIYNYYGQASFYGTSEFLSTGVVFNPGVYATVAIVSRGLGGTRIFVNGTQVDGSDESLSFALDSLRFFVDNTSGSGPGEDSAGAVSCIRVYGGELTDAEIAAIGASASCQPSPASAQPQPAATRTKKCKKHKRKHRSADAAKKKKCKKKKKR